MTITLTKPKTQVIWRSLDIGDKTTTIPGSDSSNDGFTLDIKTTLANGDTHHIIPTSGTIGRLPGIAFVDTNCNLFLRSNGANSDWIIRCLCCYTPVEFIPPGPNTGTIIIDNWSNITTAVDHSIPTVTFHLTATMPNDVIVVHTLLNAEGDPSHEQFPGEITGISGGGLTWTRRVRATGQEFSGFLFGDTFIDSEVWWAVSPGIFNDDIVISVNSDLSFFGATAIAFNGVSLTVPWDTNASLPAVNVHLNGPNSLVQVPGVSTDRDNTVILFMYDHFGDFTLLGGPPGYTRVIGFQNGNAFIGLVDEDYTFTNIVSSPLVSETLTAVPASAISLTATHWMVIVDALQAA